MSIITAMLNRARGEAHTVAEEDRRIFEALQAWKDAERFFETANGSELIDCAIYDMEAARRKYMFLLRQKGRSAKLTGGQ